MISHSHPRTLTILTSILGLCALAAQAAAPVSGTPAVDATSGTNAVRLPEITVTAGKEPASAQSVPVSDTPVTEQTIKDDNITTVKDAAIFAPNVFMNEFGPQRLSDPFFRGIGSSPNNPGITTFIDGVPQLNANSSSIQLLDTDQVEFVRGAQADLYGRNTVGGLINITSHQPDLTAFHTDLDGNYGNYNFHEVQLSLNGPIISNELGFGVAGGYTARDGYTINDVTGHPVDNRNDFFGKGQLLWLPAKGWEVHFLLTGENDHDGDYALGDLQAIRANPNHVAHDFEGFTHRDIVAPTLWIGYKGDGVDFTMITGLVNWRTDEQTGLDYSNNPTLYSTNQDMETETQFTEELRLASAKDAPVTLGDNFKMKWQTGLFVFTQNYREDAFNNLSAGFAGAPTTLQQDSILKDVGVGGYGQTTFTGWNKLDLTLGVRVDWEKKDADLQSVTNVMLPPQYFGGVYPSWVSAEKDYSEVLPRVGLAYHITPDHTAYATMTEGYKAGGFNPSAPTGSASYDAEHSMDYEVGVKTEWFNKRLIANLACFYIDWHNIQVNEPNLSSPGNYYIANAGAATSKGVELELNARPVSGLDLFGGIGYTDARFLAGSIDTGVGVGGNRLQYAPVFTANAGMQYSIAVCKEATAYARAELVACGSYEYDNQNTAHQPAYALANFRVGFRGKRWLVEGWIKNAFDTHYVPVAFQYNSPSGMIGESGAPMTCGVRVGVNF